MKVILLHGDDITKSYGRLQKFVTSAKNRGWEIGYDDLEFNPSLFTKNKLIILRDLKLLSARAIKTLQKLEGTLVIYKEGQANASLIRGLPKDTKVEEYKLPKEIWKFLENLVPGKGDKLVGDLASIVLVEPPEFVFSLISKQFRDLYWGKISSKTLPYPSWRISKIVAQASRFEENQLKNIISDLAEIDWMVKTGKKEMLTALDLLILKHLE